MSDGRKPTWTATHNNYSLSLEPIFKPVFKFSNQKKKECPCSVQSNLQLAKTEITSKPSERDVLEVTGVGSAPLITHWNVKPDTEGMATAVLSKTAAIFNHRFRPSATVRQWCRKFTDSTVPYRLPGAGVSCIVFCATRGCFLHSLRPRVQNERHYAHIFYAKSGSKEALLLD